MASKTVTRSILARAWKSILGDPGADSGSKGKSKRMPKKKKKKNGTEKLYLFSLLDFPLPPLSAPGSPRMLGRERVRWEEEQGGKKPFLIFPFPIVSRAFLTNNRRVDWKKRADVSRHHFWRCPRNDIWGTNAEIRYWWYVTTQIWVVLLIGWKLASSSQKH